MINGTMTPLFRIASILLVILGATACGNLPTSFVTMSEEELYAYNITQPVLKRVLCREETTTSSYIRKRRCYTVQELVEANTNSVLALDVLNYGANFNAGIGGSRD